MTKPHAPVSITNESSKPGSFTIPIPLIATTPSLSRLRALAIAKSETQAQSSADYRQCKTAPKDRRLGRGGSGIVSHFNFHSPFVQLPAAGQTADAYYLPSIPFHNRDVIRSSSNLDQR